MSNGNTPATVSSTFGTLWWAFLLGIGFHVGYGIVSLIVSWLAQAVSQTPIIK